MNIRYNVTGQERKSFVGTVSEILGWASVYKGAPTFAYAVGNYLIDKEGALSYSDTADFEQTKRLLAALKERGYLPAAVDGEDMEDSNTLSIQLPKADYTDADIEKLRKIITSKETLIKKALGADSLPVNITDSTLDFPWFTLTGTDGEADAYARFVSALCRMAKKQKRVTAREKDIENDKFTMRLFLIRLGFIGPEYKAARNILLKNLSGNGSFKSGRPPKKNANQNGAAAESQAEAAAADRASEEQTSEPQPQMQENGGSTL